MKRIIKRCKCDDLPAGLDLCVFDFGVNAGTYRAGKYLQQTVGATRKDCPNTIKKVNEYVKNT